MYSYEYILLQFVACLALVATHVTYTVAASRKKDSMTDRKKERKR